MSSFSQIPFMKLIITSLSGLSPASFSVSFIVRIFEWSPFDFIYFVRLKNFRSISISVIFSRSMFLVCFNVFSLFFLFLIFVISFCFKMLFFFNFLITLICAFFLKRYYCLFLFGNTRFSSFFFVTSSFVSSLFSFIFHHSSISIASLSK